MKYTQLKNPGIATNIKRVYVLDIDNQRDFLTDPGKYDIPGTLLIGCVFIHFGFSPEPIKQFVDTLQHAHARIWMFEGETIKEYGDHFLTSLSTMWINSKEYLKNVSWTICSNDKSAECTANLLSFLGVENCIVQNHMVIASVIKEPSNKLLKSNTSNRLKNRNEIINNIPLGVHVDIVVKYINAHGGKVRLFSCGTNANIRSVLKRHKFKICENLIVTR